jgi:hypothetical protein
MVVFVGGWRGVDVLPTLGTTEFVQAEGMSEGLLHESLPG